MKLMTEHKKYMHHIPVKKNSRDLEKSKNIPQIDLNFNRNQKPLINSSSKNRINKKSTFNKLQNYQNSQINSHNEAQRVQVMNQRLKNIHHFYKMLIEQERGKSNSRNEAFLGIVQDMQINHNLKVIQLKKMIEDVENQKKDVGFVDQRMNQINFSIDQILNESSKFKKQNDQLEKEINKRAFKLHQKEEQMQKLKDQVMDARDELESFELLNLKENKKIKQMKQHISSVEQAARV